MKKASHSPYISIAYKLTEHGVVPYGVRLTVANEDFVIALHDIHRRSDWMTSTSHLQLMHCSTFTKKQALLTAAFIDEVNDALSLVGGSLLSDMYWTSAQVTQGHAACVNFTDSYVGYTELFVSLKCRPVSPWNVPHNF